MYAIWIVTYGILFLVSEQLSLALGATHIVTVISIGLYITAIFLVLKAKGQLAINGVSLPHHWRKEDSLLAVPLAVFPLINWFVSGCAVPHNSWQQLVLMLYAAFLEELFFRSCLLRIYRSRCFMGDTWKGIVLSNAVFSLCHVVNLFQGKDIGFTVAQMLCALGMGMYLSDLMLQTKSIIPGTILHYFINITSTEMERNNLGVLIVFMLIGVLFSFYAYYVYNQMKKISVKKSECHETVY